MPRPTKKQETIVEPILQDFSVTSLSDMNQEVSAPSDSSLLQHIVTYNVFLPDMSLNKTEDANISSGPYPPDSTIVDIVQEKPTKSLFKKPFNGRNREKKRSNIFDSDVVDSEHDASEQEMRRPFQRKNKVPVSKDTFDIDLSSESSNISHSFSVSNKHRPFQRENKVPISTDTFDIDLSSESSNVSNTVSISNKKKSRPFQKKNKVPINKDIFDDDLLDESTNISNPVPNFITRRKNRGKKSIENNLFDKDLNTSESDDSTLKHQVQVPLKKVKTRQINVDQNLFNSLLNSSDSCKENSSNYSLQNHSGVDLKQLENQNVESFMEPNIVIAVNEDENNRSETMNRKEQNETFIEQANEEEDQCAQDIPAEDTCVTHLEKECTNEKEVIEVENFKSSDAQSSIIEKGSSQNNAFLMKNDIITVEGPQTHNLSENNNYSVINSIDNEETNETKANIEVSKTYNDEYFSEHEMDTLTSTAKETEFNCLDEANTDETSIQDKAQDKESSNRYSEMLKINETISISKISYLCDFREINCSKQSSHKSNIFNNDSIKGKSKCSLSINEKSISPLIDNTTNPSPKLLVSNNIYSEIQQFSNITNSHTSMNKTESYLGSLVCEANITDPTNHDSDIIDIHPSRTKSMSNALTTESNLTQSNTAPINATENNISNISRNVDDEDSTEHESNENKSINKEILIENEEISYIHDQTVIDEEVKESIREDETVEAEREEISITENEEDECKRIKTQKKCLIRQGVNLEFQDKSKEGPCKTQGNKLMEQNENCISQSNIQLKKTQNSPKKGYKRKFNKKSEKETFKKPHPVSLNKKRIQEILDKIPMSELKNKQQHPVRPTPDLSRQQMEHDEIEQGLKKRHVRERLFPKSMSNKLKRPKTWVSPLFYEFIINKLQPNYGLKSRIEAESTVLYLTKCVDAILKKDDYFDIVKEMKNELANMGIIHTHLDFYEFVMKFFDGDFKDKLFLSDNSHPSILPDDPFENIL